MTPSITEFVEYARDNFPMAEPILDVCAGWEPNLYQPLFQGKTYLKQDQTQFTPPTMDYVCDAHHMETIKDNSIGTVLLLEALEHLREPQLVINETFRILRPGGICIATTVMTFEIHRTPYDYWRFCPDGMCYLFRSFQLLELVLQHHRTLPRGIWCIAKKPDNGLKNEDTVYQALPKVRVHESSKSKVKNFFKIVLQKFGIDIIRVCKDPDKIEVIGTRQGGSWDGNLK